MTMCASSFAARSPRDPSGLYRDCRGVTAVEFALVAPVFLMLLLGGFDVGHMMYTNAVLNGAVESAARSSSLETRDTTAADAYVRSVVQSLVPDGTVTTSRLSYFDFSDIGRPEVWNDRDANGLCDGGEPYTDENNNGQWDQDIGIDGSGGANDVVVYTVTLEYESLVSIPFLPFAQGKRRLVSSAVRKNQPFAQQAALGSEAGICE